MEHHAPQAWKSACGGKSSIFNCWKGNGYKRTSYRILGETRGLPSALPRYGGVFRLVGGLWRSERPGIRDTADRWFGSCELPTPCSRHPPAKGQMTVSFPLWVMATGEPRRYAGTNVSLVPWMQSVLTGLSGRPAGSYGVCPVSLLSQMRRTAEGKPEYWIFSFQGAGRGPEKSPSIYHEKNRQIGKYFYRKFFIIFLICRSPHWILMFRARFVMPSAFASVDLSTPKK